MIDVRYFEDDRILAAGPDWPLHFAAILACKSLLSDGELTRRQLARIAPDSLGDIGRSIDHLIEIGLLVDKGDSIAIHAWAQWNDSAEYVEAMAQGGEYGNHLRWHARRDVIKETCSYCQDGGDRGGESGGDRGGESGLSLNRDRDRDRVREEPTRAPAPVLEADFVQLWALWRKKTDKAAALRAYQALRRAKVDHETLMRAARHYLEATKDAEKERTKGLAVFLRGSDGPWSEYLEAPESPAVDYDPPPVRYR
jgi:hypothetical protein